MLPLVTNSWLKGERTDDRIVVHLPQLIYQVDYEGEIYDYYAYRMELLGAEDENPGWYYPTESQELVYYMDGESFYMENNDDSTLLLGLCDNQGSWTGHGDITQRCEPFRAETIALPDGLKEEDWQFVSGGTGHFIKYAANEKNVYVKGMVNEFPDCWVIGEKTGEGIYFPAGQYLGVDTASQHYNYLSGAAKETYWNEDYQMELSRNVLADNIAFQLQEGKWKHEGTILVNKGMQSYLPLATYSNVEMCLPPQQLSPYPANPELTYLIEYDESWGYGVLGFNLPYCRLPSLYEV